jgi:hypothetical protein
MHRDILSNVEIKMPPIPRQAWALQPCLAPMLELLSKYNQLILKPDIAPGPGGLLSFL